MPGFGHGRGVRAAIDQCHAGPALKRAYVTTQRWLCDMALLSGSRKIAALGQREKILEPEDVDGWICATHGIMRIQYWTSRMTTPTLLIVQKTEYIRCIHRRNTATTSMGSVQAPARRPMDADGIHSRRRHMCIV